MENKKFRFYVIADTSVLKREDGFDLEVDAHEFTKEEDLEEVFDYLDEDPETEEISDESFKKACKRYLYETEVDAYEQRLITAMVIDEDQFMVLHNSAKKWWENKK